MSEEMRLEFEAWALSRGLSIKKLLPVSEIYYMESMQRAWEAWQAARSKEWQPIETAPRDGTEILVWREDMGTITARWIAPAEFMTEKELEDWSDDDQWEYDWFFADFIQGGRLEELPTFWRLIPAPPTQDQPERTI